MYWEGKDRVYVVAALDSVKGRYADDCAGMWLRLEKHLDLFTELEYYVAVDPVGRRARIDVIDSRKIMAKAREKRYFQCYYVKKSTQGHVILVFCAGDERPDDEISAALFEMPE